ncbi:MAG: 50S ribosomal protein L12, partial [Euryarchaeota archaeon]|nr:50S ribosomal protein L12 [Euryarchaeota archaeon]
MEYVYAALVLNATGKEVTEEGVTNVLSAAGATVNEARAKALIAALEGINMTDSRLLRVYRNIISDCRSVGIVLSNSEACEIRG